MTYTNVAKPTSSTYTAINTQGREQYDQTGLSYDETTIFYDGVDEAAYTDLAKPADITFVVIKIGMATGLIMPATYSKDYTITTSPWTKVNKPT